ncbi:MAG TPA: sulfurtransferase [bacterium]|nr:sulfurtransferase [bacterium]
MPAFMSPDDLHPRLFREDTAIADCRGDLFDLGLGLRQYLEAHIPGAVFIDGEDVLTGPKGTHGGRHPLPEFDQLAQTLGTNGIAQGTTVVAYGMYAARLVFLLNLMGHTEAFVLNGHLDGWIEAGHPTVRKLANRRPLRFTARPDAAMLVEAPELRRLIDAGKATLIDVRAPERFRGEVEPIDKVAGHIPGAVNVPWERNFDATGRLLTADALRALYAPHLADTDRVPVLYCGSGVTSCNSLLALREIGVTARLYAGSWSDWISYPDNPVSRGEG